jgi:hypothetical protein
MGKASDSVAAVRELLTVGETAAEPLAGLTAGRRLGLWSESADRKRCVASAALVHLAAALPGRDEAVAAVFACEERYRAAWLPLVVARLKDAGRRRDLVELCQAIDQVGVASGVLYGLLPTASLKSTGHGELETALFGAPAEQAVAGPRLLRAVGTTALLVEGRRGSPAATLADVDPLDPRICWVRGRLLRLPELEEQPRTGPQAVLAGTWCPLTQAEAGGDARQATMRWVLHRPWAFVLAQLVFTQEAWAAERSEGGLALELDDTQLNYWHRPYRVEVVVTNRDGDEVVCGSLGELVLRLLEFLGVSLLQPCEPTRLDDRLGELVRVLQDRKVWRFDSRAVGGKRPGYFIHEDFSDACYRAFGSSHFYRLGGQVTGAVRSVCEGWARERLGANRSRGVLQEAGA